MQSRAELEKLGVPVWSGQISHRAGFMTSLSMGASVGEVDPNSAAGGEISRLWTAISRSVEAINAARPKNPLQSDAA